MNADGIDHSDLIANAGDSAYLSVRSLTYDWAYARTLPQTPDANGVFYWYTTSNNSFANGKTTVGTSASACGSLGEVEVRLVYG